MFDRFKGIMNGMFNKGMTKMETPEVLAEEAEMELESNYKKIREAFTSALTTEKMLEKNLQKNKEDLALWEKRALQAVQQNDDDMARKCLAKKQEYAQMAAQLEAQLAEQKRATASFKDKHSEIESTLNEFRRKKTELLQRMKRQETMEKTNQLVSGSGGGSSMDKWEQKIAEKEAMGQAMRDMSGASKVDEQFKELDKQAGLDDELAALKANIGGGPKLIEAKDAPTKEQVDENLPMVIDETKPSDSDNKDQKK